MLICQQANNPTRGQLSLLALTGRWECPEGINASKKLNHLSLLFGYEARTVEDLRALSGI